METELEILLKHGNNHSILYVENNKGLRTKLTTILSDYFKTVFIADGPEAGYESFKENRPSIVITETSFENEDGMNMLGKIKKLVPFTKVIITSRSDEKELLFQAIDLGVSKYFKKPVSTDSLLKSLAGIISDNKSIENKSIFETYMHDIVNFQNNMLILLEGDTLLFVNQMFLDFFKINSIEEFEEKYEKFGNVLQIHKGFLFNIPGHDWFETVSKNLDKLFHTKLLDTEQESKHFILKLHKIPNKKESYILSLNDITELDLLSLFDAEAVKKDKSLRNRDTLFKLFDVIQKNSAELTLHNYYKGLTISGPGIITKTNIAKVIIKTSYVQQKAIQYEKKLILSSELFPSDVISLNIEKISFEDQTITLSDASFLPSSPTQREHIRLVPDKNYHITLFYDERKFFGEISILDVSIRACKIMLASLPPSFKSIKKIHLDMVLGQGSGTKPVLINTPAEIMSVKEIRNRNYIILTYKLKLDTQQDLEEYLAKRQLELVREFKQVKLT
ncbi:MAG: hypothetical protein COA44_03720 [Arcobacter sp.]|nr:MAG: hypothetical protein COA44_03720 [Arcobacter sp.]